MRRYASIRRGEMASWRRWLPIALGILLLLVLAPMVSYGQGGSDSVTLVWTAPGDDGTIGTASGYEMRQSLSPITLQNWAQATPVAGLPAPMPSGTRQSVTVTGLTQGTTYYFAIRAVDDAGNWSGLSNVLRWDWVYDTAPPAAPTGLAAARENDNVRVSWTANSEPDLAGYIVYRGLQSGQMTRLSSALVTTTQYLDTTVPSGAQTVWYQVSAVDQSGNESPASNLLPFAMSGSAAASGWALETGYPNPSAVSTPVTLPVMVAASGGAGVALDIFDSGGHRVRRIGLAGLAPGPNLVVWDGTNEAGRQVAPGVYSVWLVTGDTRLTVRLARVP